MLIDDLGGALGDVDVTATISGLDASVEVDVGLPALDADALVDIVADLVPPDLAEAIRTIASLADGLDLDRLLEGGIDTDALLAPLRARLDLVGDLGAPDLDALATDGPPGLGLDALALRVEAVTGGLGGAELGDLVAAVDGLVPGLDLGGALEATGPTARGVVALLQVLGGLLAHATLSRRLAADAERVRLALRGDVALAAGARLARLAADAPLAAAIRGADPFSVAAATTLLPRVRGFATAVLDVEATWRPALRGTEVASIGLDAEACALQLELASRLVASADLEAVGALATQVRGLLDVVVGLELPDPLDSIDTAVDQALELVGGFRAVVADVDAAALTAPVTGLVEHATRPLTTVTDALEEVSTALTSVLRTVEDAVRAVDVSPVTTQIDRALAPVRDVLATISGTIADAEEAIGDVVAQVVDALDEVRAAIEAAAAVVRDALAAVEAALSAVDFEAIQQALEDGLGSIADQLARARLDPYFDAAADGIETTADVVDAVPFDLLPTDLQQEVVDAVRPIRQIDVEGFSDALRAELRSIVDALDTTVLDALDAAYQEVVGFLSSLDPCVALEEFEAGPYAELRAAVSSVDPRVLLEPVEAALDDARSAVAGVDLEAALLEPLRGATGGIRDALAELAPAELLAPAVGEVAAVREQVVAALRLDDAEAGVTVVRDVLVGLLERLDPGTVAGFLDSALVLALDEEPREGPGLLASLLVALTQASGLEADTGAFTDLLAWLEGEDPAVAVRERIAAAARDLDATTTVLGGLDATALAAAAAAQRRRLLDAAATHPEGSPVRVEVEAVLSGLDVERALGGLATDRTRVHATVSASAAVVATLTPSARSELVVARDRLLDALRPVTNIGAWVRDLLSRFGISDPDAPLPSLLRTLWRHVGPDRLLPPLVGLATSMRDKGIEVVDALVAPLHETIGRVRGALDVLDLEPLVATATAVHDEVVAAVEAVDPAVVLGPTVADAQGLLDELASFDPLAPVTALLDELDATIEATFETLRPTVLFGDACDIHAQLVQLAAGLDVRGLLGPVVDALQDLGVQLDTGLEDVASALVALQAALPSEVSDSSVSGSVSVSVGIG